MEKVFLFIVMGIGTRVNSNTTLKRALVLLLKQMATNTRASSSKIKETGRAWQHLLVDKSI